MSEYLLRFPLSATARALLVGVFVTLVSLTGLSSVATAETRSLKLYNQHTGERATIAFKRNGRYIQSGLRDLNQFLRDWRRNEATKMDPELFDLIWEVYRESGSRDYIHVVSGYRSPATNNMLRSRSRGVAKKSQHTRGKAMDFFIPGANLAKLRAIGLRQQVGGVGYYPTSGSPFVHMDTGSVRHWPRMTRQQLARVFPNGRTIHIPSDGKPMPGYKQALAEIKARESGSRRIAVASNTRDTVRNSVRRAPLNTQGQILTAADSNPAIRTAPATARASGNTGGGSIFASLFGRNAPTPPGNVGATTSGTAKAATRTDSNSGANSVLPGVRNAKVTPPSKPGEPAAPAAPPAVAEEEPAAPIVVAALPLAKPQRPASPVDAIGAIDAITATDTPARAGETVNPTLVAYAPGSDPVPALRPRSSALSNNQLSGGAGVAGAQPRARRANVSGSPIGDLIASEDVRDEARVALASASANNGAAIAERVEKALSNARDKARSPVISGRIPATATDPFARFASLPRANEARLISGAHSTRTSAFADLRHPDQRKLTALFDRPARLFNAGFERRIYGSLRTDRFDGPAVVALSLVSAD
ncbi:DUF882 domain-containing protein [Breoghania sp.]|uniref:DUF882 domain-containing protein n=1 Tax=Breoghania sp. TaxID=2065378 RepID=UPI002AA7507C|nr:DUF882 domain-containing protein [Breoghania sp.]